MQTITLEDAVARIPDGASLMVGGFMGVGTPECVVDELVRQEKRDLTVIGNDTALPGVGIGKLVSANLVRKVIASHIGLNPETQKKMLAGQMEVELVPQGTLIERIRAAGHGLGGILTPTGVGTVVEEGKRKIEVEGREYLLEVPLRADFALVQAFLADYLGNLTYALTARNFNPVIAMAASTVIVDAEHIVPVGMISPDQVMTPAPLVDYLVPERDHGCADDHRETNCARAPRRHARQPGHRHSDACRQLCYFGHAHLFPVGERTDRHGSDTAGRFGAGALDRCRRTAGERDSGRLDVR